MNVITKNVQLPDGRTITIETGKLAKQTDGSVLLRMGNTVLLATVCAAKDAVPGTDFMPLQVDYREQYSAAGRFPGGFTKREGKASDNEILTSRLVDRVLRTCCSCEWRVCHRSYFRADERGRHGYHGGCFCREYHDGGR